MPSKFARSIACLLVFIAVCFVTTEVRAQPGLSPEQSEAIRNLLNLPPGSEIEITNERKRTHDAGTVDLTETAEGQGASLRANGDKIVSDFDASSPSAGLGGGREAAGGSTRTSQTITMNNTASNPLLWVGIACLLGAGWLVYRGRLRAALITAGVGVAMITCVMLPLFALFVIAGGVAVLLVAYVHREHQAKDTEASHEALRAVAAGVSDFEKAAKDPANPTVPPDMYQRLATFIKSHASTTDTETISKIKAKDNL